MVYLECSSVWSILFPFWNVQNAPTVCIFLTTEVTIFISAYHIRAFFPQKLIMQIIQTNTDWLCDFYKQKIIYEELQRSECSHLSRSIIPVFIRRYLKKQDNKLNKQGESRNVQKDCIFQNILTWISRSEFGMFWL